MPSCAGARRLGTPPGDRPARHRTGSAGLAIHLGRRGRGSVAGMSQVAWTQVALEDLQRLRRFLRPKSAAARHAADAIIDAVQGVARQPNMGRAAPDLPEYRELSIDFGGVGDAALYRIDGEQVTVWSPCAPAGAGLPLVSWVLRSCANLPAAPEIVEMLLSRRCSAAVLCSRPRSSREAG